MASDQSHGSPEERLQEIFERYYGDVAAYVRRRADADLVDDVVSETFLVAWRRLEALPEDPRPWLLGVARKILATHRRSATRRRRLLSKIELLERPMPIYDADGSPAFEALSRLREGDREALTLIAWEGLTPREAAAVLGQSAAAFRVRLHRAKRRLQGELGKGELAPRADSVQMVTDLPATKGALKR